LLHKVQEFLDGIGKISFYSKSNAVQYVVADLKDLNTTIIPHFDRYNLSGNKLTNYLI
jgi:hypothetical protein